MRAPVLFLVLLLAGPAFAQSRLTDADVRAFVERQERAWNAGDVAAWSAAFTPDARFTDQAYVGDKPPVPYGTSTLAEASAQARKARGRSREASEVRRVEIAADGRSARVTSRVGSAVTSGGKVRRLCASRVQILVRANGGLRSRGQTDTYIRCRSR
jgi:uncharacterized protein (TIGR02246 family)